MFHLMTLKKNLVVKTEFLIDIKTTFTYFSVNMIFQDDEVKI